MCCDPETEDPFPEKLEYMAQRIPPQAGEVNRLDFAADLGRTEVSCTENTFVATGIGFVQINQGDPIEVLYAYRLIDNGPPGTDQAELTLINPADLSIIFDTCGPRLIVSGNIAAGFCVAENGT